MIIWRDQLAQEATTRQEHAYGQRLGDAFGLDAAPVLINTTLKKSAIAVTELLNRQRDVMTEPLPVEDAWLIGHQANDCLEHELWMDGRPIPCQPFKAGVTTFYDLRRDPRAYMREASHCYMYYIPRAAFDAVADEAGVRRIDGLGHPPGVGADDGVMRSLTAALAPAFARPDQATRLFVEHITLAVTAHLLKTYGDMPLEARVRGGLAAWQERRAKAIIDAHLDGEIPLAWLAHECGLSPRHFARAFRQSTSVSPHRWLLERRVEVAKDLLRANHLTIAEVAQACGFADQSHFTRVFSRLAGAPPAGWRRQHGGLS